MKTLHAKSPCCRGRIIRYGRRRRQCVTCKKTWRIREKRRGRKSKRVPPNFFLKYLNQEIPSLYVLARTKKTKSEDRLKRELRCGLKKFLRHTPWPILPTGKPLIAVADAMIQTINKKMYTFYFILLRTIEDNKAIIAKPYVKQGPESWLGWQEAFNQLPGPVLGSILALVSDGHTGLISAAKRNNWIIQRCHFHLIAKIQGRRSRWTRSRHREIGQRLYFLAREVLTNSDEKVIQKYLKELTIIEDYTSSRLLKTYLSGFIRYYKEYRTYLYHPELNLPTTSNSVESIIGSIRKLCHRAHGFRTIESLILWTHALLKNKKFATCNGKLPTKLMP